MASDVEAEHFRFRFRFQQNLKTASASASASMLPGDFHEKIDEVKNYTLKFLDRIRQMQFSKQPSKFNPKIFFSHNLKKSTNFFWR